MQLKLFLVALAMLGGVSVVGLGSDLGVRQAWADPPKAPAPSDPPAAVRARQAAAAGRDAEAIAGLKSAYEQTGQASLLFELGELHHKLGRDVEAERFYKVYLARDPRGPSREAAERRLRQIDLTGDPSRSTSVASPNPPASSVPAAPATRKAAAHPIDELPPPAAPAPASAPSVHAPSEEHGPAPVLAPPSAPTAAEGGSTDGTPAGVALRDLGAAPDHGAELPIPRAVPWTGAVLTVGLLAGAIVVGTGASHRYDELRAGCGATAAGCSPIDVDGLKSKALVANLLWAATAVAGVATGITVYIDAREGGISRLWTF